MKWNNKKQANRLEALKYSVINDIEKITSDSEIDLRENVAFRNPTDNLIGEIKRVSSQNAIVEINGDSNRIELSNIDIETLIDLLYQLEDDAMLRQLNYPDCCIKHFKNGSEQSHNVNWGGFKPCLKHKDLSLEEITQLLGRNPVTDDKVDESEPDVEIALKEHYKEYFLEVFRSHDGTYHWICSSIDENGNLYDDIAHSPHLHFSKEEALEKAKKFADNYEE